MTVHRRETDAYRGSGIGRKHPIARHFEDGFRNGAKRVEDNPNLRQWYAVMALNAARSDYATWPPYRAYQLGFAKGARS